MTLALVFGGNGEKIKTKYKAVRDDLDCDVYRGLSDLYIGSKARGISYNRVIILSSCIGSSSMEELAEYVRLNPATTVILLARKGVDDALATKFVNIVHSSFAVAMLVTSTTQVILEEALNLDAYEINEKYGIRVEQEISLRSEQAVVEEQKKEVKVEAPKKKGFFQRIKEANEAAKRQLDQQRVERQNQQIQEQTESHEDCVEDTANNGEYENDGYEEGYADSVTLETGDSQYSNGEYEDVSSEEATDFEPQTDDFSELPDADLSSDDDDFQSSDFTQGFESSNDDFSSNDGSGSNDDSGFFTGMSQPADGDLQGYHTNGMSQLSGVNMSSLLADAASDSLDDIDVDLSDDSIGDIDFSDFSIGDDDLGTLTDSTEGSSDAGDKEMFTQVSDTEESTAENVEVPDFNGVNFDEAPTVQSEIPVEPVYSGKKTKRGFFGFGRKKKDTRTEDTQSEGAITSSDTDEVQPELEVLPQQSTPTVQESVHRVPRRRLSFGGRQPVQEVHEPVEDVTQEDFSEVKTENNCEDDQTGFASEETTEEIVSRVHADERTNEKTVGRAVPAVRPPSGIVEVDDLFGDDIDDVADLDTQYRAAESTARVKVVEKIVEREVYREGSVNVRGGNKSALAGIFKGKLHKIILVTGSAGSGVTTLAWDLAKFLSKGCHVLYVDGNVRNHGILNYIDYERFADYEDQQKQGVRLCRNPKAFSRCVIRFDRNIDLLVSDFFVDVDDDQFETMQSTLTDVARDYGVVVVDVPLSKIHLCEELISAGNIAMTCELSKRGVMNLCSDFNASPLRDKYKRTIVSRGTLVYTKVAGKGFSEKDLKKYVDSIIEFDEDDANFLTMTSIRREKDIKDTFVEEILEG